LGFLSLLIYLQEKYKILKTDSSLRPLKRKKRRVIGSVTVCRSQTVHTGAATETAPKFRDFRRGRPSE